MEANLNPKPETGIADVGLTVGDYVGNAAVIVGNSVVEAAETSIDALPSEIKDGP